MLARRMYTKKELEEKLRKDGYTEKEIHKAVEDFQRDGYLNDEEYMKRFVEERRTFRPRGFLGLKAELSKRGISSFLLDGLRDVYSASDEVEDALGLLERWTEGDDKPDRNRLFRRLYTRGFSESAIENAWRKLIDNQLYRRS